MAFDVVNKATKVNASGNSTTLAYPGAVTAGSTLVCTGWCYNTGGTTAPAISDSVNGAWTINANSFKALSTDNAQQVYIAYKQNTAGGTPTVTVNPSGASAESITFSIQEVTDADLASFDVSPTPTDTALISGAGSIASGALGQADEVIFAVMAHSGASGTTITPDATYTQLVEDENNSPDQAGNAMYKIVAVTTSDQADWTVGTLSDNYNAVLATFRKGAGGGGGETITMDKWFSKQEHPQRARMQTVASGTIAIHNT